MSNGGPGRDFMSGGQGDDSQSGGPGADKIFANPGRDTSDGGDGPDMLWALARVDVTAIGDPEGDELSGGNGRDLFLVRDGEVDLVHCGEGRDRVVADQFDQVDNDCERVNRRDITSLDQVEDREENRTENPTLGLGGTDAGRGGAAWYRRPALRSALLQDVRVAPSILSADFARLGAQVEEVMDAGARVIHVDVMDGHFVPPISIGALIVDALRDLVHEREGVLDVHLMVERPERRVEEFAAAGADTLIVHWEATPHVHYALQAVRAAGLDAGPGAQPRHPARRGGRPDGRARSRALHDREPGLGRPALHRRAPPPRWRGCASCSDRTPRSRWTAGSTPPPPRPPARPGPRCSWPAPRSSARATPRWPIRRSRRRSARSRIAA